jgi:hypothetical protein
MKDDNIEDQYLQEDKEMILQLLESQWIEAEELSRYLESMNLFAQDVHLEHAVKMQQLVVAGMKDQYLTFEKNVLATSTAVDYNWFPNKD